MSKLTETYDLYEVVKVPFPFADVNTKKIRPALIISSSKHFNTKIGMSVMAMITSLKPAKNLWPTDLIIENLKDTGLSVSSIIRFKIFTLDHRLILGGLGRLGREDQQKVHQKLKEILIL